MTCIMTCIEKVYLSSRTIGRWRIRGGAVGLTQLERRNHSGHETLRRYRDLRVSLGSRLLWFPFLVDCFSLVSIVESGSNLYKDYPAPQWSREPWKRVTKPLFGLHSVVYPNHRPCSLPLGSTGEKGRHGTVSHRPTDTPRLGVRASRCG